MNPKNRRQSEIEPLKRRKNAFSKGMQETVCRDCGQKMEMKETAEIHEKVGDLSLKGMSRKKCPNCGKAIETGIKPIRYYGKEAAASEEEVVVVPPRPTEAIKGIAEKITKVDAEESRAPSENLASFLNDHEGPAAHAVCELPPLGSPSWGHVPLIVLDLYLEGAVSRERINEEYGEHLRTCESCARRIG